MPRESSPAAAEPAQPELRQTRRWRVGSHEEGANTDDYVLIRNVTVETSTGCSGHPRGPSSAVGAGGSRKSAGLNFTRFLHS